MSTCMAKEGGGAQESMWASLWDSRKAGATGLPATAGSGRGVSQTQAEEGFSRNDPPSRSCALGSASRTDHLNDLLAYSRTQTSSLRVWLKARTCEGKVSGHEKR